MCIEINEVKPKGNKFYKVFALFEGRLCWAVHSLKGDFSFGRSPVEEGILESTEEGFHVWQDRESAEILAKTIKLIPSFRIKETVIKEVFCEGLIKSGLAVTDITSMLQGREEVRAQAFAFKKMKIIDK